MKKYTGMFTKEATKAAKSADRLFCQVTDDGAIYVANGFVCWKMNKLDYAAVIQPATCCDAGNWSINKGGERGETMNIKKIFDDAVAAVQDAAELQPCPACFTPAKAGRALMVSYYNAAADFAAFYDKSFIATLSPFTILKTTSPISAAIAYAHDEPVALVLPIKADDKMTRAVKAYFADKDNSSDKADELSQARAEIAAMREQIAQQAAELATMQEAQQAAPVDNKPEPKTAAELIAARFTELPGVTATIKGAQTAAPVVWLAGDTEQHADEIKAAGAKWSSKKAAYYVRVA